MVDSDDAWIRLGDFDPYLRTVRTLDPYKLDPTLSQDTAGYFASGERYVADLFFTIDRHVKRDFRPRIAVDFGCSVGRVALPLAKRAEMVVGLDVSSNALREAEANAVRFGIGNARWLASDDALSQLREPIDLFHSYNVLQHMPVDRGMEVIGRALALLAPDGVIAVHVPYADRASSIRHAINWAQAHVPGVHRLANLARRRPHDYPLMLMNTYDLTKVLALLHEHGYRGAHCKFIDQGRYPGAIVIAARGNDGSATG